MRCRCAACRITRRAATSARLTELGFKVAVCEQMEDPKLAKGLVKREIVRVITPGVVLDDEILDPKLPRYLAALVPAGKKGNPAVGLAYLDATTGELCATEIAAVGGARRAGARRAARGARGGGAARRHAGAGAHALQGAVEPGGVPALEAAEDASSAAAGVTDGASPPSGRSPCAPRRPCSRTRARRSRAARCRSRACIGYEPGDAVVLDETAIANLELTETLIGREARGRAARRDRSDGDRAGRAAAAALAAVSADRRRADPPAAGRGRLARRSGRAARAGAADAVAVADLERLAGKATLGVATPRDLGRLRDALAHAARGDRAREDRRDEARAGAGAAGSRGVRGRGAARARGAARQGARRRAAVSA